MMKSVKKGAYNNNHNSHNNNIHSGTLVSSSLMFQPPISSASSTTLAVPFENFDPRVDGLEKQVDQIIHRQLKTEKQHHMLHSRMNLVEEEVTLVKEEQRELKNVIVTLQSGLTNVETQVTKHMSHIRNSAYKDTIIGVLVVLCILFVFFLFFGS
jgi:hypothetical protein